MKILLVRPPRPPQAITIGEFMFAEPLGLECVYGVIKNEHQVEILDMMVESVEFGDYVKAGYYDCVGITSLCIDVEAVLLLARKTKEANRHIKVVVGGTQAQLQPAAFVGPDIDYIVTQATTANVQRLFSSLATGNHPLPLDGVVSGNNGDALQTHTVRTNEYLVPDRGATAKYRYHYSYFGYKPCALLQTSQGCSKCCRFCLRWRLEGGRETHQDMEVIFRQIREIPEESIMIVDNDFLCDSQRLESLCSFLEREKIKKNFICYGSVHSVLVNQKSVERFARNGLRAALVGYESFSENELSEYNKKSSLADSEKVSGILRNCGVDVWASFIMHPDWHRGDFSSFRRYIRKLHPEISSLTPLTPFPGLPYFDKYRDRLLVDKHDYGKWSFGQVTVQPSKMSLRAYYIEVLKTNLYINFFMNNAWYLVRKFGWSALWRIAIGSLKLSGRYLRLLRQG